jgi:hypothetical protein
VEAFFRAFGANSNPFEEAQTAFDDPLAAYYPDSLNEARFIPTRSRMRSEVRWKR